MKLITYSLLSLSVGLLATPALAQEKASVNAKPVIVSICNGLPGGIGIRDRPSGYRKGASVTFFLQGENMTSIDTKSFESTDWKLGYGAKVSKGGESGYLTLFNKSFEGESNDLKVDAAVDVLIGSKSVTKKVTLKQGADPMQFPNFTVELELGKNGVKVIGDFSLIQSISIMRGAREKVSNGFIISGDNKKTFILSGIKDGDEVSVTYWADIVVKSVKLTR